VLGGLRDRFVDTDPFGSTMLFTATAGGAGLGYFGTWMRASADASLVYVKQRYAPNAIHSDEPLDAEAEAVFGFARFAGLATARLEVGPLLRTTLGAEATALYVPTDAGTLGDRDLFAYARVDAWSGDGWRVGLSAERYARRQTLRRDGESVGTGLARAGIFMTWEVP
jgi:hypothetical protein